jgi:hypothetical protein
LELVKDYLELIKVNYQEVCLSSFAKDQKKEEELLKAISKVVDCVE